ncbi:MAG: VOC family protein, partial [Hyphomicrobiaceae bacterium]|nr:VOC family protein [Hyphomicrobiaceae bacterium]
MIDHVSVAVADLDRAARFYDAVLGALGMTRLAERPTTIGYGKRYPELWLNLRAGMAPIADDTGAHLALRTASEDAVRAFHA